jgi:hypothetical protein
LTTARVVFLHFYKKKSSMNLPDLVPELKIRIVVAPDESGEQMHHLFIHGSRERLVPRQEATTSVVVALNSVANTEALSSIAFISVYFDMASISALQRNLDRLLEQCCNLKNIYLGRGCDGAVEMAACVLFKSKCRRLSFSRQCLAFTPALAEALCKSASLNKLVFEHVNLDKAEMERLALCLCENASVAELLFRTSFKGDECMVVFAKYLPRMSFLRSLCLGGNEFGEAGERALVEVLEQGDHSLNNLFLEDDKPILQKYVDFLLDVKRNGGKPAISQSSGMKWIELLARASDYDDEDPPSALYFTLCSDPDRFENL